jgi:hypothetical protein
LITLKSSLKDPTSKVLDKPLGVYWVKLTFLSKVIFLAIVILSSNSYLPSYNQLPVTKVYKPFAFKISINNSSAISAFN